MFEDKSLQDKATIAVEKTIHGGDDDHLSKTDTGLVQVELHEKTIA